MELNQNGVQNRQQWEMAGYILPQYDRKAMIRETDRKSVV